MWTGFQAGATLFTAIRSQQHLDLGVLALRVVAPPAMQGASFKEDGRANTGTIVDGIFLDIKDDARQGEVVQFNQVRSGLGSWRDQRKGEEFSSGSF